MLIKAFTANSVNICSHIYVCITCHKNQSSSSRSDMKGIVVFTCITISHALPSKSGPCKNLKPHWYQLHRCICLCHCLGLRDAIQRSCSAVLSDIGERDLHGGIATQVKPMLQLGGRLLDQQVSRLPKHLMQSKVGDGERFGWKEELKISIMSVKRVVCATYFHSRYIPLQKNTAFTRQGIHKLASWHPLFISQEAIIGLASTGHYKSASGRAAQSACTNWLQLSLTNTSSSPPGVLRFSQSSEHICPSQVLWIKLPASLGSETPTNHHLAQRLSCYTDLKLQGTSNPAASC